MSSLALLGLAGALLHVINHGLFKGLLFLSGGAVIRATHTRNMSEYGGLLRAMPLTGFFFLGGAVAICGLPPLNGFVSEWLIYLGLFNGGLPASGLPGLLPAVAGLALIGGLALLCFTKVFGLCFLGGPRPKWQGVAEAPGGMLAAMAILLAACFGIGLAPLGMLPLLSAALRQVVSIPQEGAALTVLAPAGWISFAALLMFLLLGLPAAPALFRRRQPIPSSTTWGCGYGSPLPRARYTPSSFAETIMLLFRWGLRTRERDERKGGLFPHRSSFASHTPDLVLDLLIMPLVTPLVEAATRFRRMVQHGVLGTYLLYSALILCLLLVFALYPH